jgi:hypothetical protein
MTAPTPDPTPAATPDQAAQPDSGGQPAAPEDTTDWKAEARKWEQRAKDNQKAAKDLDTQRKAAMDEGERKILEAREAAAAEVRLQYGSRLAQTEFRAAAAARNSDYDVSKALAYVDLSKFVGEDGEPDAKAIKAAVADLVPQADGSAPPPSFDGGTRTASSSGPSMTQLIRQAAGRA